MTLTFHQILQETSKTPVYKTYEHKFNRDLLPRQEIFQDNSGKYRHYITPDGRRYPSVTSILSKTASEKKKQGLIEWRKRVGEDEAKRILTKAVNIGNRLHDECENYLLKDKAQAHTLKDENMYEPMFEYLRNNIQTVMGVEIPLYSDKYRISGTCDCVAIVDGKYTIVDFKNSVKWKHKNWIEDYRLQCVMYSMMLEEMYGIKANNYQILMAVQNGYLLTFDGDCDSLRKDVIKRLIQYWT